ncbi:TnsA-like heteromeric transposase endonuclease subunit (plasmid) [Streptomyces viridifaciens]|nr:TnsA-like heteromeric transposase endonuclease subunit [Streptomyces viridifaciens]
MDPALIDACFFDPLGREQRMVWADAVQQVAFERCGVVRRFPVRAGRRVAPGWWWSATDGRLVHYGSGLMRMQVMLLDRDPSVVGLACRPVELLWRGSGAVLSHAPHLLARLADGTAALVDCVGRDGMSPEHARRAAVVAAAAAAVGWHYRAVGPPDPVLAANVRWLAGYRHPRYAATGTEAGQLLGCYSRPRPLIDGVRELGDPLKGTADGVPRAVARGSDGSADRAAARTGACRGRRR